MGAPSTRGLHAAKATFAPLHHRKCERQEAREHIVDRHPGRETRPPRRGPCAVKNAVAQEAHRGCPPSGGEGDDGESFPAAAEQGPGPEGVGLGGRRHRIDRRHE